MTEKDLKRSWMWELQFPTGFVRAGQRSHGAGGALSWDVPMFNQSCYSFLQTKHSSKKAVKKLIPEHQKCKWLPCFLLGNHTCHAAKMLSWLITWQGFVLSYYFTVNQPRQKGVAAKERKCRKCNFGTFTANILTIS